MKKFDHGLVLGKFYPLTRGHQFLINSALEQSERLTIVLGANPAELIPAQKRFEWLKTLYPQANVVMVPDSLPAHPDQCRSKSDFYAIWSHYLRIACNGTPDAFFSSENYGVEVAESLACEHVMVDLDRAVVPISGTKVRVNPFAQWDYLDPVVRSHFVKTVCVFGPESAGKTTLSSNLAKHFHTIWQPEYAREFLGDRHCVYSDMANIAEGHFRERQRFLTQANKVLFSDTDTLITKIYSKYYYGTCSERVEELIHHPDNQYDLYLFAMPDVPWVPDIQRDLGSEEHRCKMLFECTKALINHKKPYVIISGSWEHRLQRAVKAVDAFVFGTGIDGGIEYPES